MIFFTNDCAGENLTVVEGIPSEIVRAVKIV
jgi:hypothetical protein